MTAASPSASGLPARVIVIHRVDDYDTWKQHFDAAAGIRGAAGESDFEVLRSVDDGNLVVHSATWTSVEEARAFFESSEVTQIRADAGVESPEFLYLDTADSGTLTT